jgi:mRNA-degrading endonuclease toxin of MazEF toxin-antitoxin module
VSKHAYHPERGDIIHVNFSPSGGHEFADPHYALVLSTQRFSKATGFCIVLPLTTKFHPDQKLRDSPLMVRMPKLAGLNEQGWVYLHQIRSIDYRYRGAAYHTRIDDENLDFLIDVMDKVRAFIDPDSVT